jgi:hypothetical protein
VSFISIWDYTYLTGTGVLINQLQKSVNAEMSKMESILDSGHQLHGNHLLSYHGISYGYLVYLYLTL